MLRACGVVSEDLPRCGLSSGHQANRKKRTVDWIRPLAKQAGQRLTAAVKKGRLVMRARLASGLHKYAA
jgi:hypothetical protein